MISFHPLAEQDLIEAIAWYEIQQAGLGERFLHQVRKGLEVTQVFPEIHSFYADQKFRRTIVQRFPYVVLYYNEHDDVIIVAIFPTSMDPDKLDERLRTVELQ